MKVLKIFKILEDPMLPLEAGKNFQEIVLLLNNNHLIPGDIVMIDNIEEYQAIIKCLPQKNKDGTGYYYTMILITCNKEYFIPNKHLQKNCKIVHIGAAYAS